ncbi:VanW family protein [Rubrobacter aplysinae]|uniref:VanW family protein n=1 Tax=Rubrobacter aplysinae TaxID=909625 RepID=UPI00064B9C80|nr:VanW family protein [Rubrobacter aplysinae]
MRREAFSKARGEGAGFKVYGRGSFRRRRRTVGAVLLALVLAGVLVAALGFSRGDEGIRRGVEIGGVDVGGMSKAEARQALEAGASQSLAQISFVNGSGGDAPDGGKVSAQSLGIALDDRKSVEKAYDVGRDGNFVERSVAAVRGSSTGVSIPAAVSYDRQAAEEIVSGFAGEVDQQPENASYEASGSGDLEVVDGEPGSELDVQKTLGNLDESLPKLDGEIPLATKSVQPEKSAENLQSMAPTKKLGEFETDYRYSDSEARKQNLRMSSGAVDGTVLEPGEVFSMNEHIAGLDYKKAKVFADGGETSALGGGLCQVTSTVYMAAQYAGLEIVERTPHYTTLPYIRPGFDATVWFGGQGIPELDMKFKNTTDSNVLIREYVTEKGILKAEIWGQPNGKEVTMRSEQDFKDTDRGIKWSTYKTVKKDGEVIREGLLHEDLYSYPPPEASDEGYNDVRVGGW